MTGDGAGVSLRDYIESQFKNIIMLLDERKEAQELAMQTAFIGAEKAVLVALVAQKEASQLALVAQKEAITKSELAADQRAVLTDKRIQELTDRVNIGAGTATGSSKATSSTWAYIFSAVMALVGVASVIVLIIAN